MAFASVVALADLAEGELRAAVVDGRRVVVLRFDGAVYAYDDRCAHQGVALSEGRLDGYVLTCTAHDWFYDVRSGQGISPPMACLQRFAVNVEDGQVFVDVSQPA